MLRWPQHFSGQEGLGKMSKDRGCETIFVSLQLGTLEWFCWTHTNWMYDHSWDPRPFVKKAVTAWHGEIFHSWLQYTLFCCKRCCLPFWPIHYSPPSKSFRVCMSLCSYYLKNNCIPIWMQTLYIICAHDLYNRVFWSYVHFSTYWFYGNLPFQASDFVQMIPAWRRNSTWRRSNKMPRVKTKNLSFLDSRMERAKRWGKEVIVPPKKWFSLSRTFSTLLKVPTFCCGSGGCW